VYHFVTIKTTIKLLKYRFIKNVGENVGDSLAIKKPLQALSQLGLSVFGTKFGTRHLMGGRSTEAKFASSPPIFSKFQIFFKNFPALPLGKSASNF
jgi:hypothetical protein